MRTTPTVLAALVLSTTLLFERPVAAQPAMPDLVRLRDGGMVRGTIAELVPGDHVVIVLPTGETRRFEASLVEYAGAASAAPAQVAPAGAVPPPIVEPGRTAPAPTGFTEVSRGHARLRLVSDTSGITFHRVTGSATATAWGPGGAAVASARSFDRLCAAPCEVDGSVGIQELALSIGTDDPIPVRDPVSIGGDATLNGVYTSRSGLRAAGWVTLIGGMGAGIVMMFAGLLPGLDVENGGEINPVLLFGGTGVMLAGAIAGVVMVSRKDIAEIEVR